MGRIHRSVELPEAPGSAALSEVRVALEPLPSASCAARQALEVFASSVPAETYADLRVIVTELVTNGVKYGPGEPIDLAIEVDPAGTIRGHVDDGGAGGVRIRPPGPFGGGLGLVIVDALASWGVYPDSSHVWFELEPAAVV